MAMAALSTGLSVAAHAQTIKTLVSFPAPTQGVAVDPVRNLIYVVEPTGGATDDLAVISGGSDTVIHNIAVPSGALFVAVEYVENRLYVAGCNYNLSPSPCTVTILDGNTEKIVGEIPVTETPGFGLTGIVVDEVTKLVYIANGSDNAIDVLDACEKKIVAEIDLDGNSPAAIAINPIQKRLYVPYGTNLTGVVNTATKSVVETTDFGSSTVGAAANLVTGHVFVTDQEIGPAQTGVLDKNGNLLKTLTIDDGPLGVDVDSSANLAFVAISALDELTVIDGATNTVKAVVTGVPASYVAVNASSKKVYVSGRTGVTVLTEK
jgi:DNA-binding beta-propeller fold protein YncE